MSLFAPAAVDDAVVVVAAAVENVEAVVELVLPAAGAAAVDLLVLALTAVDDC